MSELQVHNGLVLLVIVLALASFAALMRITAPYGRHMNRGWGPLVAARTGWLIMESPAVIVFAAIYFQGDSAMSAAPLALLAIWMFHYVYRAFVFPFRLSRASSPMPVSIAAMGFSFNCLNAYINARWISELGDYPASWLSSAAFVVGVVVFMTGWAINQHADAILLSLRRPGESEHRVPQGGLFRYVSCPNYLGEIVAWAGWAIATWSLAGLAFAIFTLANLLPRARANHDWYKQRFADYPRHRHALIPYLL